MLVYKKKINVSTSWSSRPEGIIGGPLSNPYPVYPLADYAREVLEIFTIILPNNGVSIINGSSEPEDQYWGGTWTSVWGACTLWLVGKDDNPPSSNYGISVYNTAANKILFNSQAPQVKIENNIYITNSAELPIYATTTEPNIGSVQWFYTETFPFKPAIIITQQYVEYIRVGNNFTQFITIFKVSGNTVEIGKRERHWVNHDWFPPSTRKRNITNILIVNSSLLP